MVELSQSGETVGAFLKDVVRNEWFVGVSSSVLAAAIVVMATFMRKKILLMLRRLLRLETQWPTTHSDAALKFGRLLVVDDQSFAHYERLEKRGYKVTRWMKMNKNEPGGFDANYDALILDVRGVADDFGAADGVEALRLIRRDNPWIPILIYTAYPDDVPQDSSSFVASETEGCMSKLKPFVEFEAAIVSLFGKGRDRSRFARVLAHLGVANSDEVLTALQRGTKPKWKPIAPENRPPFQERQVEDVMQIARSVVDGTRWKQ